MAFPQAGLQNAVNDCITGLGTIDQNLTSVHDAYIKGHARGFAYGAPLDHTTIAAGLAVAAVPADYLDAVNLQQAATAASAADTANDATRSAANTADEAAVTATQAAVDGFAP